ncbi:hypothetical protein Q8A64_03480 [Oxalobacteraceae bacterium R-40]|uniref:Uncharacterized protein n=1 Tax=Keguizhuia sedimenti TaxID=3064264 RepID=A0ABU1BKP8_9BURK|nr:hypothetical protein [Oxalobacteraceae bacterium R-40]
MQKLFPTIPSLLETRQVKLPSHEWVAPALPRKNHSGVYRKLPAGTPDCLCVNIIHFTEGVERCTAAVYGERVYVIHYEFKAHARLKD